MKLKTTEQQTSRLATDLYYIRQTLLILIPMENSLANQVNKKILYCLSVRDKQKPLSRFDLTKNLSWYDERSKFYLFKSRLTTLNDLGPLVILTVSNS